MRFCDHSIEDESSKYINRLVESQKWPREMPWNLVGLAKSASFKYGLDSQIVFLKQLSSLSAHLGSGVTLGGYGEFGVPLNLSIAIGMDRRRSLNNLFRTLDQKLYEAEAEAINDYNMRRGKPVPTGQDAAKAKAIVQNAACKDDRNEALKVLGNLHRTNAPQLFFEDGKPASMFKVLEGSQDRGLYALSDKGGPIPHYLGTYSGREKAEFIELVYRSQEVVSTKSPGTSDKHWDFLDTPHMNIFWILQKEHFMPALRDGMMQDSGFWNPFILLDIGGASTTEGIRAGFKLQFIDAWRQLTGKVFGLRSCYEPTHVIECGKECDTVFENFRKEVGGLVQKLPPSLRKVPATWVTLSQKLAGLLQIASLQGFNRLKPENALKGVILARWAGVRTLQVLHNADSAALTAGTIQAEEIMLGKLREKAPITSRELFRSYRKQGKSLHIPVLDKLKAKGLVTEGPEGLLRPAS